MSPFALISVLLLSAIMSSGFMLIAESTPAQYAGSLFNPEAVPSGMIPYDDGWSHGSLFSAPNWLLAQIDQNIMSTVLDYGVTPVPTEAPQNFQDYISAGFAALEGGNYREAYNAFKMATQLESTSSDAWYGLSIALESQKKYLSALEAYTKAISAAKGASSNWASYAGKGRVLYNLNRFTEAKSALETAISRYEEARVSHPDELEEIYRLLDEISGKTSPVEVNTPSAYIPASTLIF